MSAVSTTHKHISLHRRWALISLNKVNKCTTAFIRHTHLLCNTHCYHVSLCLVYLSTLIAPSTTINLCMYLIPLKSIFYTLIRLASSVYGTSADCLSMSSYFWSPPGYSWLSIASRCLHVNINNVCTLVSLIIKLNYLYKDLYRRSIPIPH